MPEISPAVPTLIKAFGNEVKLAIDTPPGDQTPEHDDSLLRVVVQGNDWWGRLLSGEAESLAAIAKSENVSPAYVRRLIDLAFLAPDITAAILDGQQPLGLTAKRLAKLQLPTAWDQQRTALGITSTPQPA